MEMTWSTGIQYHISSEQDTVDAHKHFGLSYQFHRLSNMHDAEEQE